MKTDFQTTGEGLLAYPETEQHAGRRAGHDVFCECEVRIGKGRQELLALESSWRTLAATLPDPCFIHSFDWQWLYLQHLAKNPDAIFYFSFFANGQAIAIFPLRRILRSVGRLHLWLWEQPSHPHLTLCDLLVSPEWVDSGLIRCLLKTLNEHTDRPWDALHFHHMLEDSAARNLLLAESPMLAHVEKTGHSMYFQCTDIDTALARCSREFRRNLRRQGRKLASRGEVGLTLARCGTELDTAFSEFLRLEASGWKGCEGKASAIACRPELVGFYSELKDRFAATNACLIALQTLDGVAIAAQLCLLTGSTLYIQKIAYDESWRAEAPGNQLLLKVIEYACATPEISRVSLVTGPAWAAGRWKPENLQLWEAFVFKSTPRGLGALAIRRLKTRLWEPGRMLWASIRNSLKNGRMATTKDRTGLGPGQTEPDPADNDSCGEKS